MKRNWFNFLITCVVIIIGLFIIWKVLSNPIEEPPMIETPPIANEKPAIVPCFGEKCI